MLILFGIVHSVFIDHISRAFVFPVIVVAFKKSFQCVHQCLYNMHHSPLFQNKLNRVSP